MKPCPEVVEFSKSEVKGPVLDIGCGNCRNLIPFLEKGERCFGLDFSEKMIEIARKFLKRRDFEARLKVGDMTELPFENDSMGTVISNSALHCLTKREDRLKALFEMKRVLKKNSMMLVSVWSPYHKKIFWKALLSLFTKNRLEVWVDWDYHGEKYSRSYYLYTKKKVREDMKFAGFSVEKVWLSKGNVWVLARR
ncbi:hypothetical protein A3K63_00360 [Candidatus Micrarchaeota archaeon RBG_16_49_10]|nr:MAG: hypothetical protein A3K63_00360 [Candidatus Micrarchaeota archaeon RBG_16_49_10]